MQLTRTRSKKLPGIIYQFIKSLNHQDQSDAWTRDVELFAPIPMVGVSGSLEKFERKFALKQEENPDFSLDNWVCQEVDFSAISQDLWNQLDFRGALFLGCTFPSWTSEAYVRHKGGQVWEQFKNFPFKAFRSKLYDQNEMIAKGDQIWAHYLKNKDFLTLLAQSVHDYSMSDALATVLENRTPIGIMGGHRLQRSSLEYKQVVYLCRTLARQGFLILTGGGPGAMEAANLGGYLARRTDEEVEIALQLIALGGGVYGPDRPDEEYRNSLPAELVIQKFGLPDPDLPSVGIPTFRYGHEPSNRFASLHAKFFSNAIREDGLLQVSTGGLIYVRGGAGTRQEIFQAACHNTYASSAHTTKPLVFIGEAHWEETGLYRMLEKLSSGEEFAQYLLLSDENDVVVNHLISHATKKDLPLHPIQ